MDKEETKIFTISTTTSNHKELKKLAKKEGLPLSQYLVLKGLGRLKVQIK